MSESILKIKIEFDNNDIITALLDIGNNDSSAFIFSSEDFNNQLSIEELSYINDSTHDLNNMPDIFNFEQVSFSDKLSSIFKERFGDAAFKGVLKEISEFKNDPFFN